MWQGQWYSSARVAKHTHGETARCAGMRGMSQRSFGAVAVLTARDCRARLEGSSSSAWAWNGMGSAPGGRRTWRSAQGTPNLAYCALRGELISSTGRVSRGLHRQNWRPPSSEYSIFNRPNKLLGTHPLNWSFPQRLSHFSQYGSIQGLAQSPRECGSSVFRAILRDPPKLCGCNVRYRNANPSGISHGR